MNYAIELEQPSLDLFSEIRQMDVDTYGGLSNYCNIGWYLENYGNLEWITTLRDPYGSLRGYFCIVGMSDVIFEAMKAGYLRGDYSLSPRAFLPLKETNKFYIASVIVNKQLRGRGMANELRKKAMSRIRKYHNNIELVSLAVSDEGTALLKKAGLNVIDEVGEAKVMYGKMGG